MPVKSQAQLKAMAAAAAGRSTLGIPAAVGREYLHAEHGKSVKGLPMHVKHRVGKARGQ